MARSTGTLDACYGGETILLLDSLHLVGRGGEGEWLLQLVAHVQTQFQVLDKKRLLCLTLEHHIASTTSANLLHVLQRLMGGEAAIYDRLPLAQDCGTG